MLFVTKYLLRSIGYVTGRYDLRIIRKRYNEAFTNGQNNQTKLAIKQSVELIDYIKRKFGTNNIHYYKAQKLLSDIYYNSNSLSDALRELECCLELIHKYFDSDVEEKIDLFFKISYTTQQLDRFSLSLEYYNKLFGINEFTEVHTYFITANTNLAQLYLDLNLINDAEELLLKLKNLLGENELRNNKRYYHILLHLSNLYSEKKDYELAEKYSLQAIDLFKRNNLESEEAYYNIIYNLANVYLMSSKLDLAEYYSLIGLNYYEKVNNTSDDYFSFKQILGNILIKQGNITEGLKNLEEVYHSLINKNEELTYGNLVLLIVLAEVYSKNEYLERAKDIYLRYLKLYYKIIKEIFHSLNESQRLQFVKTIWTANSNLLSFAIKIFPSDRDFIKTIFNYRILTKEMISLDIPKWNDNQDPYESLIKSISDNAAIIEIMKFVNTNNNQLNYLIFIITKENTISPDYLILENGTDIENNYLKNYWNCIQNKSIDLTSYKVFWKPILPYIESKDEIFLSSDGALRFINFDSLLSSSGEYVILNKKIRYTNNLISIRKIPNENFEKSACLFGSPAYRAVSLESGYKIPNEYNSVYELNDYEIKPLPETKNEVNEVASLLNEHNWKVQLYIHDDASKNNFMDVNSPTILHVATHGYFLPNLKQIEKIDDSYTMSGILLSGCSVEIDGKEYINFHGVVTPDEIRSMNLQSCELVVLSVCQSGLGFELESGDYLSLQRAFYKAGAKSIIISLWEIDDKISKEFITEFYSKWLINDNKFESFREAQLILKQMYPNPFYWASFMLIERDLLIT